MGINYQSILDFNSAKPSLSELLSNIFMSSSSLNLNTRSYQEANTAYLLLKNLIGDESFDLQTVNGIKTWTLKLDQAALLDAITKTALTAGNSAADLSSLSRIGGRPRIPGQTSYFRTREVLKVIRWRAPVRLRGFYRFISDWQSK